ncbi:hypothetical protein [Streptomyces gilvosporeus]|uniref:hypothetical protein n=1 Tax=Streptomyces gilvosporeus TaxID=553510 RepID=UPI0033EE5545
MGLFSRLRWRKESGESGVPSDEAGESAGAATDSVSEPESDPAEAGEVPGDALESGDAPESGEAPSGDAAEAGAPAAKTSGSGRATERDGTAVGAGSPGIPRQQSAAAAADSEADDRA